MLSKEDLELLDEIEADVPLAEAAKERVANEKVVYYTQGHYKPITCFKGTDKECYMSENELYVYLFGTYWDRIHTASLTVTALSREIGISLQLLKYYMKKFDKYPYTLADVLF